MYSKPFHRSDSKLLDLIISRQWDAAHELLNSHPMEAWKVNSATGTFPLHHAWQGMTIIPPFPIIPVKTSVVGDNKNIRNHRTKRQTQQRSTEQKFNPPSSIPPPKFIKALARANPQAITTQVNEWNVLHALCSLALDQKQRKHRRAMDQLKFADLEAETKLSPSSRKKNSNNTADNPGRGKSAMLQDSDTAMKQIIQILIEINPKSLTIPSTTTGNLPLHYAILQDSPSSSPPITNTNMHSSLSLHHNDYYYSLEIIQMLIRYNPETVLMENHGGVCPFNLFWERYAMGQWYEKSCTLSTSIRISIPQLSYSNASNSNDHGGDCKIMSDGASEISKYRMIGVSDTTTTSNPKEELSEQIWRTMLCMIQAADSTHATTFPFSLGSVIASTNTNTTNSNTATPTVFRPLVVLAGLHQTTIELMEYAKTVHPDQCLHKEDNLYISSKTSDSNENLLLPLHVALSIKREANSVGCSSNKEMIVSILEMDPSAAKVRSKYSNYNLEYPMFYGIMSGIGWDDGLYDVFCAFPDVLFKKDSVHSLYPFMMAACGDFRERQRQRRRQLRQYQNVHAEVEEEASESELLEMVDLTYRLLRECPGSVQGN